MSTLNQAIEASYKKYILHGARSNKKITPLHSFIARTIQGKLGNNYEVSALGFGTGKEDKIQGNLYDKKVDVSITDLDHNPCGAVSIKFVTSNYKQNARNYIENLLGETFNVRSSNYIYAHIFIIKNPIPYLDTNKRVKSIESMTAERVDTYRRLITMPKKQFSIPDLLFFKIIDTGDSYIYQNMIHNNNTFSDGVSKKDLLRATKIRDFDIKNIPNIKQETIDFYNNCGNFEKFIGTLTTMIVENKT